MVISNKNNFLLRTDFFEPFFTLSWIFVLLGLSFISVMLLLVCWILITLDQHHDGPGFSDCVFLGCNSNVGGPHSHLGLHREPILQHSLIVL